MKFDLQEVIGLVILGLDKANYESNEILEEKIFNQVIIIFQNNKMIQENDNNENNDSNNVKENVEKANERSSERTIKKTCKEVGVGCKNCSKKDEIIFKILSVCISSKEEMLKKKQICDKTYSSFVIMSEFFSRAALTQILNKNIFAEWTGLIKYLRIEMSFSKTEQFRVVFVTNGDKFKEDYILSQGTVDQSSVYIREIISATIKRKVRKILIVHNHPSDDCSPSDADFDVTQAVSAACTLHRVELLDHIIITKKSYFSFKNSGMM